MQTVTREINYNEYMNNLTEGRKGKDTSTTLENDRIQNKIK